MSMLDSPSPVSGTSLPEPSSRVARLRRRNGWVAGVAVLLVVLLLWQSSLVPTFGPFQIRTITAGTMTLAFLAMAQAIIVISGGIDLSVGAMMVLVNCIAARWMEGQDLGACLLIAAACLVIAIVSSTIIGLIITASGIPDIIVTLAASFTLAGIALLVLDGPGGGTSLDFQSLLVGGFSEPLPSILWIGGALLLVWLPLRRSRRGFRAVRGGQRPRRSVPRRRRRCSHPGDGVLDRRLLLRRSRPRHHRLHRQRRTARVDRRHRHAGQCRGCRARRCCAHRRRRWTRRARPRRHVPNADPTNHAGPRLGSQLRRGRARRHHHRRRHGRRAADLPTKEDRGERRRRTGAGSASRSRIRPSQIASRSCSSSDQSSR